MRTPSLFRYSPPMTSRPRAVTQWESTPYPCARSHQSSRAAARSLFMACCVVMAVRGELDGGELGPSYLAPSSGPTVKPKVPRRIYNCTSNRNRILKVIFRSIAESVGIPYPENKNTKFRRRERARARAAPMGEWGDSKSGHSYNKRPTTALVQTWS